MRTKKLLILMLAICVLLTGSTVRAKKKQKKVEKINYGIMKCTAYCPCCRCSKGYGRSTTSGESARSSHTIAVDTDVICMGSKVQIEGFDNRFVAEDTGSGVRGEHIDIFFDTHDEVEEFGTQYIHCWVIRD